MSADWHPDPLRRAHLRYFDGAAWTHHVATNGQQSVEPDGLPLTQQVLPPMPYPAYAPPVMVPPRGGGRLIAAGILAIISGVFTAIVGLVMVVVANDPNAFNDCTTSDTGCTPLAVSNVPLVVTIGALFMLVGALFVVAGIGGCMRRRWGQIMIISTGSLGVALYLITLAVRGNPAMIVPVIWFSTVTGLAIGINRAVFEDPRPR